MLALRRATGRARPCVFEFCRVAAARHLGNPVEQREAIRIGLAGHGFAFRIRLHRREQRRTLAIVDEYVVVAALEAQVPEHVKRLLLGLFPTQYALGLELVEMLEHIAGRGHHIFHPANLGVYELTMSGPQ